MPLSWIFRSSTILNMFRKYNNSYLLWISTIFTIYHYFFKLAIFHFENFSVDFFWLSRLVLQYKLKTPSYSLLSFVWGWPFVGCKLTGLRQSESWRNGPRQSCLSYRPPWECSVHLTCSAKGSSRPRPGCPSPRSRANPCPWPPSRWGCLDGGPGPQTCWCVGPQGWVWSACRARPSWMQQARTVVTHLWNYILPLVSSDNDY